MTISAKNYKIPLHSNGEVLKDAPEVNLIFGKNLRKLCATRPSISAVSQDLDIGRVQFGRLLTGHSFPKPFVLERICAYFGVDARILLEPMDDFLIERMARSRAMAAHPGRERGPYEIGLSDALSFAAEGYSSPPTASSLRDGLYEIWRMSTVKPGMASYVVVQVKTIGQGRIARGYAPKSMYSPRLDITTPEGGGRNPREFRAVIMEGQEGSSITFIRANRMSVVTHYFVHPTAKLNSEVFVGLIMIGQREALSQTRLSRCVWVPIEPNCRGILRAARTPPWHKLDDLDPFIRDELIQPLG